MKTHAKTYVFMIEGRLNAKESNTAVTVTDSLEIINSMCAFSSGISNTLIVLVFVYFITPSSLAKRASLNFHH